MTGHDSALTRRRLLASGVAVSAALATGYLEGDNDAVYAEPSVSQAQQNEQLNVTQQVAPIEWDPIVLNDAYSNQITQTIYDGLYEYEPQTLDPQPKLAADDPEVERDGERYILELEDGPEFHNGDPVTAEDVVHTFLAPVEEETDNMPDYDMIEDAEAIDDQTVQFDLEHVYGPFETIVLPSAIVNAEARQDDPEAFNTTDPVGSGPYQFVDATIGEFVDVERWDDYWDEPSEIEEIRFEPAEDDAGRVARILGQETHIMEGIPPADWEDIEATDGVAIESIESTGYLYMAFNCREGPTADPDVREAVALCHSPQDFVEGVLGEAASYTNMVIAPEVADEFDIDQEQFLDMAYEFDPEEAQSLLDGSDEIDEGDELEIIVPPDDIRQAWGELIADRLGEIGYGGNVRRLDWDVFTDSYTSGDADEFNIYSLGWTGGADPDVYFYQLFHEDNEGITQGHFYDDDDFHEMIRDARRSIDDDERSELYTEIQTEIIEEVVHIPGWNDLNAVAYLEDEVDGVLASTTTSTNPHLDHPDLSLQ